MRNKKELVWYGILGVFVFVIDRFTKLAALHWCDQSDKESSFLSCHLIINRGISWGLCNSESSIIFLVVSVVITLITVFFAYYAYRRFCAGYCVVGEIFVFVGSVANIVDRFYYYGVIDFILFSYNDLSFPVFNFADIAIVCGIGMMLAQNYWEQ